MDFSKILPAIGQIAPTIAGLLGGPLASMGVQALESVFGFAPGTVQNDPDQLVQAVANMSPDTAIKLAQIDADLKAKLVQGGLDLTRLGIEDTANARAREIAVKDKMPAVLSLISIAGTWALLGLAITDNAPALTDPRLATTVGLLVGLLVSEAKQAYHYYLGSSLGSAKKDDTIQSLSQ